MNTAATFHSVCCTLMTMRMFASIHKVDEHRRKELSKFSAKGFQTEIRSLRTLVLPSLESVRNTFHYIREWESPFLTLGVFVCLLWLAVADLAKYIIPIIVFANVFGIMLYGALTDEQKVRIVIVEFSCRLS